MSRENEKKPKPAGPPLLNFKEDVAPYLIFPGLPETVTTPDQAREFLEFLANLRTDYEQTNILLKKNNPSSFTLILQIPNENFETEVFTNVINNRQLSTTETKYYLRYLLSIKILRQSEIELIGKYFGKLENQEEIGLSGDDKLLDRVDSHQEYYEDQEIDTPPSEKPAEINAKQVSEKEGVKNTNKTAGADQPAEYSLGLGRANRKKVRGAWRRALQDPEIKDLFIGTNPRLDPENKRVVFINPPNDPELNNKVELLINKLKENL